MHPLAKLDHAHVWHPFTQMRDWLKREPIVITSGKGTVLRDANGREYLDANSSIWTNLHGHQHPKINAAITRQLKKISHSSALGLANEPASVLAERLVQAASPAPAKAKARKWESEKAGSKTDVSHSHLPTFPPSHFPKFSTATTAPPRSKSPSSSATSSLDAHADRSPNHASSPSPARITATRSVRSASARSISSIALTRNCSSRPTA